MLELERFSGRPAKTYHVESFFVSLGIENVYFKIENTMCFKLCKKQNYQMNNMCPKSRRYVVLLLYYCHTCAGTISLTLVFYYKLKFFLNFNSTFL